MFARLKVVAREILKRLNLLGPYHKVKGRIQSHFPEPAPSFYTLSPDLLVAIHSCLRRGETLGILNNSDYLEFGIYRGFAFWYSQATTRDMNIPDMRFFGFDSFTGLPEMAGRDKHGDFRKGQFRAAQKLVENNLNTFGVDWNRTFLIPGFFSDSLNEETKRKNNLHKCSLCVIDCDLYESARYALNFVSPLLHEKAFIIFDDWNCYNADPDKGERKAFSEFLSENPGMKATPYKQFGTNCQVFFIEKKENGVTLISD